MEASFVATLWFLRQDQQRAPEPHGRPLSWLSQICSADWGGTHPTSTLVGFYCVPRLCLVLTQAVAAESCSENWTQSGLTTSRFVSIISMRVGHSFQVIGREGTRNESQTGSWFGFESCRPLNCCVMSSKFLSLSESPIPPQ